VDTSVWSHILRRRGRSASVSMSSEMASLVEDGRVAMIGSIRQELLSVVRELAHFERLREHLRAFPDVPITTDDYEQAASFYNLCRARGIQGSNTDFLICAIAARNDFAIFTMDEDFTRFAKVLPIALHKERPVHEESV